MRFLMTRSGPPCDGCSREWDILACSSKSHLQRTLKEAKASLRREIERPDLDDETLRQQLIVRTAALLLELNGTAMRPPEDSRVESCEYVLP